jgi:putative ABC transport system permease protein
VKLLQDLRYGARQLRANPGFTVVAVASLALGIGANSAIFQLVDAVRLRTLPVAKPQELVYLDFAPKSSRSGWFSTRSARFTSAGWEQLRANQEPYSGVIAWSATKMNLSPGGEARYAEGLYVSGDFFRVLGVQPLIGRTITPDDDQPGCGSPAAVVSYAFWTREFGGDPGALGRTVSLDGRRFPVIGVTPPSFFGVEVGNRYDVAIPLCSDLLKRRDSRTAWWLSAMARLKPGWTEQRANAYMQSISPAFMQATLPPTYRPDDAKRFLTNKLAATAGATGVSGLRRQYEKPLWLLLAATGLILLIACANVANLLLARASVRERELAIRQAIGASRSRLIAQLLSESLLLAALGTILGIALAQLLSRGLIAFLTTEGNGMFVGVGLDLRMIGFTAAVATAACLLFGLLPAFRATRLAPVAAMRAGGRGLTSGRERFTLRRALVTAQVALSLVLLVGALLFVGSLKKLLAVDPGFNPDGIVAVSIDFRGAHFPKERLSGVVRELGERLRSNPGVISAAQVLLTPISGSGWNERGFAQGATDAPKESFFNRVAPGYLRTMGTPLLAGRDFNDRDVVGAPPVAIVNEAFAKSFYGGANPVGKTFRVPDNPGKPDRVYLIVGLARNTKYYELREDPLPITLLPSAQDDDPDLPTQATYVLRTSGPMRQVFDGVKSTVAGVNPGMIIDFKVLSTQVRESLMRDRLMAVLAGAFGILAALLATIGLYGVIAYMVARRQNEIGVRLALGAGRGRVIGMVLREAVGLLAAGLIIGTALARWATGAAEKMLFGLKPSDPATFAAAIALLATVALVASYAPARKASRVEPMQALREE